MKIRADNAKIILRRRLFEHDCVDTTDAERRCAEKASQLKKNRQITKEEEGLGPTEKRVHP